MTRLREYLSQTQLDFEVERMLDELQGDRNNAEGYNNGGKEDNEELGELYFELLQPRRQRGAWGGDLAPKPLKQALKLV